MIKNRVIPALSLLDNGLVKTRQFKHPRYIGDPINAIRIFNEKEVDELLVLDISASKVGKEPNYELIEHIASECFMPLCYGGGITSAMQAQRLFSLGVEKVCLQNAAIKDISIIREIADRFGSQSVVISVDVKKTWRGKYGLYSAAKGKTIKQPWIEFMCQAVAAGAGEVVINSVDQDGMMSGMDLTLIKDAAASIPVPLIALGGVGSLADIKSAIDVGASAVAVGAFFVFHGPHRAVLITYPDYREIGLLR